MGLNAITTSVVAWQGYRHKDIGVLVYYDSSKTSMLPIRAASVADPNYETKTCGLYGCNASQHRTLFVKNKFGYLFFMTKYQGKNAKLKDKMIITGYYKIGSIADVQKAHMRYVEDNSCYCEKICYALKASVNEKGESDAVFLSDEDAYVLNDAALKMLGIEKKITKATKVKLDEDITKKLLKKFEGKENKIADYISQTQANSD
ncbi:MAG: hypothetical protein FWF51_09540 [Chitinivibrionia bacterium]|nr:hypothetical protein [Chitinivibrionia bacterium]